jgi:hypothetical protein
MAIPPLKALLNILAHGAYEGMTLRSPEFRALFDREVMLKSDWYAARVRAKLALDQRFLSRTVTDLKRFLSERKRLLSAERDELVQKLEVAEKELTGLSQPDAIKRYEGTLGLDPALV